MRDSLGSGSKVGGQMQLTILSAEILKSQIGAKLDISISCNISELPNYHCVDNVAVCFIFAASPLSR